MYAAVDLEAQQHLVVDRVSAAPAVGTAAAAAAFGGRLHALQLELLQAGGEVGGARGEALGLHLGVGGGLGGAELARVERCNVRCVVLGRRVRGRDVVVLRRQRPQLPRELAQRRLGVAHPQVARLLQRRQRLRHARHRELVGLDVEVVDCVVDELRIACVASLARAVTRLALLRLRGGGGGHEASSPATSHGQSTPQKRPPASNPPRPLNTSELNVLRAQYEKEGEMVGVQTKFNYAWGLVKSNGRHDQQLGVRLLSDIFRLSPERRRECLYYLALGNYKLGNYGEARRYNDLLLDREPANLQASDLRQLIDAKVAKEGLMGVAILSGVGIAAGVVGAFLFKNARRR
ncbi:tetratricopeptide repeat 11 Fission 1 protein [Purpureocillium lavendulum]|uniref:Mitochondrial fission 1 protein n=1 Tax=Purpureocillium lavendulum TaxID=1247861 RepID=A0AB34G0S3_9HYPO|nr:tetratricopeptide repeat 11 Fission 1 protein [Purpureocillium lavendulum]